MPSTRNYQPLPKEEDVNVLFDNSQKHSEEVSQYGISHWRTRAAWMAGALSLLTIAGLVVSLSRQGCSYRDMQSYSPAQDAIKYHTMIYPDAIHHKTKYMGKPSPQLDAAWESEYDLISRIPKWQADQIETPSDELPNDPGYHAVMLDIFHSLHCLNEVRMTLNPEYYGPPGDRFNTTDERIKMHLDHCIEHIRMALWCNADVSPIPFQKGEHGFSASHVYTHTCRDKDSILEWARENRVRGPF
ncbi:hypothetical protein CC79DRAFT_907076 [Sarocladium strictum]